MIPPSFIQDLLARTDIADVVGKYVTLKKAGINLKGLCPFHGEKSPSFIVSPSRQTYHCFGCGVHGNAVGFLMEHGGLGFIDAVKDLAQLQGMQVPEDTLRPEEREQQRQTKEKQATLTDVMAKATQHWKQQLKNTPRAVAYLKARGLTGEVAARFAIGYAPDNWRGLASAFPQYDDPVLAEAGLVIVQDAQDNDTDGKRYDRFRDRIMFPIRNPLGDVIGFGGRVLDKGEPKYLNSPETPVFIKGRELYGLFEARSALRNKGYVIVTEGYMDVVALAQWGYGNAVATLGTACTAEHAQKLFRFTDQVVFSFDGDKAGRNAAGRALEAVLPHATDTRRISFLFLPAEHDPDSYIREHGPEAFEACIKQAAPLSRQVLEHASADCDLDTAEGRARLLVQAIPLIAQFPTGALRGLIGDELAQLTRTAPEDVRKRLAEHQPEQPSDAHDEQTYRPPYTGKRRDGQPWKPWRDGSGSRWQRQGSPIPQRSLPTAATPLDRIVWVLVSHSDAWENLPSASHDLLCDQPLPYGEFFRWLDRLLIDQGLLSADELLRLMQGEDAAPNLDDGGESGHFGPLANRIQQFHAMPDAPDAFIDLNSLIKPLELQALRDELELLNQSGELSEAAETRKMELMRASLAMKLEISQQRPFSG